VTAQPARYAPGRAFPPYAFLPGRDPHPTGDPRGHSYTGKREAPAAYFEASRWRENGDFLFGCDLYNHGYLWEAHEAWEGLWHRARHDADQADLLQGLIQCSAASLKIPMEQPAGRARLAELGTGRLERVARAQGGHYMGLDLFDFVRAFREFAAQAAPDLDARPRIELSGLGE
jgi:uncharacterized protein